MSLCKSDFNIKFSFEHPCGELELRLHGGYARFLNGPTACAAVIKSRGTAVLDLILGQLERARHGVEEGKSQLECPRSIMWPYQVVLRYKKSQVNAKVGAKWKGEDQLKLTWKEQKKKTDNHDEVDDDGIRDEEE